MGRSVSVLSAPSNLGLMPPADGEEPGVYRLPAALKVLGLVEGLGAEDRGTVPPPVYSQTIDPATGVRNSNSIREYSIRMAGSIKELVSEENFVLVLGGDCSILLGSLLGLRRKGRYGLIFVNGHTDFQSPDTSATAGAAGMDLALATGRGPIPLTRFDNQESLISDELVFIVGFQDEVSGEGEFDVEETAIRTVSLEEARSVGWPLVADQIRTHFEEAQVDGYWIHLDVDVLDIDIMPAVDSPHPGGMTFDELSDLVDPLLTHRMASGMEVTMYDPSRDPSGDFGRGLTDWLVQSFRRAGLAPVASESSM